MMGLAYPKPAGRHMAIALQEPVSRNQHQSQHAHRRPTTRPRSNAICIAHKFVDAAQLAHHIELSRQQLQPTEAQRSSCAAGASDVIDMPARESQVAPKEEKHLQTADTPDGGVQFEARVVETNSDYLGHIPHIGSDVATLATRPDCTTDTEQTLSASFGGGGGGAGAVPPVEQAVGSTQMMAQFKARVRIGGLLGKGSSGLVKRAVDESGSAIAIKMISKLRPEALASAHREVRVMQLLNGHQNVLRLEHFVEDRNELYLVQELAAAGDLFDAIASSPGGTLPLQRAHSLFVQLIKGLEHCHDHGVVQYATAHSTCLHARDCHGGSRDLKPENLLLTEQDCLKITDFGLSRQVAKVDSALLQTHCGSVKYAAPEVLQKCPGGYLGPPVDIWSAGVVLHVMVAGLFPFSEATPRCDIFLQHLIGSFPFESEIPGKLRDMLRRMWVVTPSERMPIHEIQCHPWVANAS